MIRLYNDAKIHSFIPCDGAEIKYKRIGPTAYNSIIGECFTDERKKDTDWSLVAQRCMEWGIVEWSGFGDEDGNEAPVNPGTVSRLPESIKSKMFTLVIEDITNDNRLRKDLGDDPLDASASTSNSNSTSAQQSDAGDIAQDATEIT